MVHTWNPKSITKKRKKRRLTEFETQLEMAKISWAPVLECLSLLDSKYRTIEELPLNQEPYHINLGRHVIETEREDPDREIRWITGKQIQLIHDNLIITFGGALGISDKTLLDALLDRAKNSRVFGVDTLETVIHKAAFLMHGLLRYHQFVDGQKRTGLSTAFIFLGLNGYTMWSRNILEEVHYCMETAQGEHEVNEITGWLANRIGRSDILTRPDTIAQILSKRNVRLKCSKCQSYISPKAFRFKCVRCGREYEVKISNAVLTSGISSKISYNVGLYKLEDSKLVTSGIISIDS
jgi:death on curing protein